VPLVVCIDTNVFVRETHLLRKNAGPPLIHFLRAAKGKLFVPEILRNEYLEQTIESIAEARDEIDANYDRIQTLMGSRDDYAVPSNDDVRRAAESRISELSSLILESSTTTDELLVSAAHRVIAKMPPTTKSDHGYKDCLIWENILRLPPDLDVRLVTHDKAFLSDSNIKPELKSEALARRINVIAYTTLESVLKELQLQVGSAVIEVAHVTSFLNDLLAPVHARLIAQWNLSSLGGGARVKMLPYYTQEVARLYVTFKLRYDAGEANVGGQQFIGNNYVELDGSFTWQPDGHIISDLQIQSEKLIAADGALIGENRTVFPSGAIAMFGSRRTVPYRVKKAF
jgi:hypothetical protein